MEVEIDVEVVRERLAKLGICMKCRECGGECIIAKAPVYLTNKVVGNTMGYSFIQATTGYANFEFIACGNARLFKV